MTGSLAVRGIHDEGLRIQWEELHMPGGMAATAQLFGNLSCGQGQVGAEPIENAALAHAGVAREGGELSLNSLPEFFQSGTRFGAGGDHPEKSP